MPLISALRRQRKASGSLSVPGRGATELVPGQTGLKQRKPVSEKNKNKQENQSKCRLNSG